MSYEGRVQFICENGHLDTVSEPYGGEVQCPTCKGKVAWENSVDDTNCDAYGLIPDEEFAKVLVEPEVVEYCNLGHRHVTADAVYRIPKEDELRRHYINDD